MFLVYVILFCVDSTPETLSEPISSMPGLSTASGVRKRVISADVPGPPRPERGYKKRNDGPPKPERGYKKRHDGPPKARTRPHSPNTPFYKTAFLCPLDSWKSPSPVLYKRLDVQSILRNAPPQYGLDPFIYFWSGLSRHSCTRVRGPPVALHVSLRVSQQISSESWGFQV